MLRLIASTAGQIISWGDRGGKVRGSLGNPVARVSNALHLDAIWQDIAIQADLAYDIDQRFVHYDITSAYFEGEYTDSEKID